MLVTYYLLAMGQQKPTNKNITFFNNKNGRKYKNKNDFLGTKTYTDTKCIV